MKIQKSKRSVFFGYLTMQILFMVMPWLGLCVITDNVYWGLVIVPLYLVHAIPVFLTMKNGIPTRSSKILPREVFLRWKMLSAYNALACAYGILLFGALFAYQTGDNILGAIIGTVGVFCCWQAIKGVRFFVHTA